MMLVRRLCFALAALSLSFGCYFHGGTVRGVTPQPQLHLPVRGESIFLALGPEIPAEFESRGGFRVKDFRGTLTRGFVAGFRPAFPNLAVEGLDHPDLVLELDDVQMWFDTTDEVRTKYLAYDRYKVRIRFHARLVDRDGRVLSSLAGEVASRQTDLDGQYVYADAIAAMYEQIGDKLFWK